MTNAIKAITDAIDAESAHDLARALAEAGVSTIRAGDHGSDDEVCYIKGYGTIFYHDLSGNPGWVVRGHHQDDCDYPVDDTELATELAEVVAWTKKIS